MTILWRTAEFAKLKRTNIKYYNNSFYFACHLFSQVSFNIYIFFIFLLNLIFLIHKSLEYRNIPSYLQRNHPGLAYYPTWSFSLRVILLVVGSRWLVLLLLLLGWLTFSWSPPVIRSNTFIFALKNTKLGFWFKVKASRKIESRLTEA